jgi:hypothetical protein
VPTQICTKLRRETVPTGANSNCSFTVGLETTETLASSYASTHTNTKTCQPHPHRLLITLASSHASTHSQHLSTTFATFHCFTLVAAHTSPADDGGDGSGGIAEWSRRGGGSRSRSSEHGGSRKCSGSGDRGSGECGWSSASWCGRCCDGCVPTARNAADGAAQGRV